MTEQQQPQPVAYRWRRVRGRGPWEYRDYFPGDDISWLPLQVRDGGEVEWPSVSGKVAKP